MKTIYIIILCLLSAMYASAVPSQPADGKTLEGTITDKISGETLIRVNI